MATASMQLRTWWRIGWRNLGRNPRRTMLTAGALALGYMAVVLLAGLMDGLVAQMIENGTELVSGQVQLHSAEFLSDRSIYETIGGRAGTDVKALLEEIEAEAGVRAAAPRLYGGGLVSSGAATAAATLVGIDPELESRVTRILDTLVGGRPARSGANEMLIGTELARRLGVEPGDEIVVVAPAADGSLGNDLYTVAGVYETGLPELDGMYAFASISALQMLLALEPPRIHEIVVSVTDPWQAPAIRRRLSARLAVRLDDARLRDWTEFSPELVDYARLSGSVYWIVIVIVFGMAIFGVLDTILISTFERRREFAVLMALGTTPLSILAVVVAEAVALAVLALLAGGVALLPLLVWWHNAPPDLSWLYGDFTLAGALVKPVLRVEYSPEMVVFGASSLFITAVAAALYPAIRAARIAPADILAGE